MQHVFEHHDIGVLELGGRLEPIGHEQPGKASESCSFIWHPNVRIKNLRGTAHST